MNQQRISDVLGSTSILCWVFAQAPQLVINYRNGSSEGLALPFLLSWLMGDVTNLLGCILTDQLPFQTYLAAYFVFIDVTLTGQFLYYARNSTSITSRSNHHHHHRSHHIPVPESRAVLPTREARGVHMHASTSALPSKKRLNSDTAGMQASFVSERAIRNTHSKRPRIFHLESTAPRSASFAPNARASQYEPDHSAVGHDGDDIDLRQSIQSLASQASSHSQASTTSTLPRGRKRDVGDALRVHTCPNPSLPRLDMLSSPDSVPEMRQASISRQHSRVRTSTSRSRSIVFLSIWMFVGVGRYLSIPISQVVSVKSSYHDPSPAQAWIANPSSHHFHSRVAIDGDVVADFVTLNSVPLNDGSSKTAVHPSYPDIPVPEPQPIDYKRLIGRVSAWICVVFYLTSRMPQIWKNFRRRSVEGLSILLFVAAFHGNLFYVASILSSPLVQEEEGYLSESIPFLLGSGGTLVFDLTILFQSWLYTSGGRNAKQTLSKRGIGLVHEDEEAALLEADDPEVEIPRSLSKTRIDSASSRLRNASSGTLDSFQDRSTEMQRSPSRTRPSRAFMRNDRTVEAEQRV